VRERQLKIMYDSEEPRKIIIEKSKQYGTKKSDEKTN